MLDIYVDADACPVKDEVYRVARRYDLKVFVVSDNRIHVPARVRAELVVVRRGYNAADDWIAERIEANDIAVSSDIPLADRCIKKGARVLGPKGEEFTENSIGEAMATRDLMNELRQMGAVTGGPSPFAPKDRSRFLAQLDTIVQAIRHRK